MTPKSLVLDLMRVAYPRVIEVRSFVRLGELFGLTGNAVRVAVTRLFGQGLLERDERGSYRLSEAAAPLSTHVEQWRLGEHRVRPWADEWLAVWLPRGSDRTTRRASRRALSVLGFREGRESFWVRPHNLAQPCAATFDKLDALGLEPDAEAFVAKHLAPATTERWTTTLWPVAELRCAYREAREALEQSECRVESLPIERAAAETFVLGGEAIRVLATDPLLPDEIAPSGERAALTDAMLRYDAVGRRVWTRLVEGVVQGFPPPPPSTDENPHPSAP